jgi:hypothetical protein
MMIKATEKITVKSADEHTFEWGAAPDAKQFKVMEIVYTRKKWGSSNRKPLPVRAERGFRCDRPQIRDYFGMVTFAACSPFGPRVTSNST